jgi:hypothetical protein
MVTKSDKLLLGDQLNQLGAGVQCFRDLLYRHYKGMMIIETERYTEVLDFCSKHHSWLP